MERTSVRTCTDTVHEGPAASSAVVAGGGSAAHNPEIAGSNPAPARTFMQVSAGSSMGEPALWRLWINGCSNAPYGADVREETTVHRVSRRIPRKSERLMHELVALQKSPSFPSCYSP